MHFDFGKILQRTHTNTQTFFIYLPKMWFVCFGFFLLEGGLLKFIFSINFLNLRNSKMFVARKGK